MTRRQLLANTDALELSYWKAKEAIDGPYGKRENEIRTARQTMHLAAAALPATEHNLVDYLPGWFQTHTDVMQGAIVQQSEEEMKANFLAIKKAWESD